jgi:hypothetical protein
MKHGYVLQGWAIMVGVDNTMRRYTAQQIARGTKRLRREFIGARVRVNVYEVKPGRFDPRHGTWAQPCADNATYADPIDIAGRADSIMRVALWVS